MAKKVRSSQGQILIISLFFLLILMALSGVLVSSIFVYSQQGRVAYAKERAMQLAEAGIDKALREINQSGSYIGESNTALGGGVFTVTVSDLGANQKLIESTGFVPDAASPAAQRTVRVELYKNSVGVSFIYGVQVGFGGLFMKNNAQVVGSVYSNGTIEGSSGAVISGDAFVAGGASPSPDQEQTLQTGEQNVGDISAREDAAQSFAPSATQLISRVSLFIKKSGNPSNATVRIVPDNGGSPANSTLASGTLNAGSVGTSFGWVDVSMTSNPQLDAGQTYWIVIDINNANATRYYIWGKHDNAGYGNGVGKHSEDFGANPATWIDSGGDFGFQTWMGVGTTELTTIDVGADAHAQVITDADIIGDAYYQTISGSTVGGTSYPGSNPPPTLDMPISDAVIEDFKAAALAGGTTVPPGGVLVISGQSLTLGPRKIEGDLLLDNNAVVTLNGPVWVDGDVKLTNNSILQLDPSFGSDSAVVVADYDADPTSRGKITVDNNAQINGSGDPGSYIMLLSTYSHVGDKAIEIKNNTAGAIFYSSDGTTLISNNAVLKEVVAYRLELDNNAAVIYESGLADVQFSSGPTGGWVLKRGTWRTVPP